jgi:hypothetical protein
VTFEGARRKLARIAGKKYHTVKYELSVFEGSIMDVDCSLYVEGGNIHSAPTWAKAFEALGNAMIKKETRDKREQPGEEVGDQKKKSAM